MTGMHMISCIRFSLQLLITESIYTFGLKRKKYFFWRILLGIVLYFGLALTTFYLLAGIPFNYILQLYVCLQSYHDEFVF